MINYDILYKKVYDAALKACKELGPRLHELEWLYENPPKSKE